MNRLTNIPPELERHYDETCGGLAGGCSFCATLVRIDARQDGCDPIGGEPGDCITCGDGEYPCVRCRGGLADWPPVDLGGEAGGA